MPTSTQDAIHISLLKGGGSPRTIQRFCHISSNTPRKANGTVNARMTLLIQLRRALDLRRYREERMLIHAKAYVSGKIWICTEPKVGPKSSPVWRVKTARLCPPNNGHGGRFTRSHTTIVGTNRYSGRALSLSKYPDRDLAGCFS